jgi:hypothetical protein
MQLVQRPLARGERPTFVEHSSAPTNAHDRNLPSRLGGTEVKFHVGDRVKLGSTRIGTITDVGSVLIEVKTSEGRLRVVCPWEIVRIPG